MRGKSKSRLFACWLPMTGCAGLILLGVICSFAAQFAQYGSLHGRHLEMICWQEGSQDGGWFSVGLPQREFHRITDIQGLMDFSDQWPNLGAVAGPSLITLAFQQGGDQTFVHVWGRKSEGRWELRRTFALPFRDHGTFNSESKLPAENQEDFAAALACSPDAAYGVVAWRQGEHLNLYRLDLVRGGLERFAQLEPLGEDYSGFHLACDSNGSVYVQTDRLNDTSLIYFDPHNRKHVLAWHDYVFSTLTGNYGADTKVEGNNVMLTLSNLDQPQLAPERYSCNAVDVLNQAQPTLMRRTGACSVEGVVVSSDGQWIMAKIRTEDMLSPKMKTQPESGVYVWWRRHHSTPAYGCRDFQDHPVLSPIGIVNE